MFARWMSVMGSVAAVAGTVAVVVWSRDAAPDSDPLQRFRSRGRIVEARLTAFDYAAPRAGRSARQPASDSLARLELKKRLSEAHTAENLQRLALAELVSGETAAARDLLDEATRLEPRNASLLSDLAAVELALGHVADAAESSGRALQADPRNTAAAFNWALSLERLGIRPAAIEAWQAFLDLDSVSGWAGEARAHLTTLRQPRPAYAQESKRLHPGADAASVQEVVQRFPQRSRGRGQNILLPQWIERGDAGDLALMRMIAQERARLGDPYLLDIVEHAARNRNAMRAGIAEFTAARADEEKFQWDAASEHFSAAADLLQRAGSPLAIGAAIYAAQGEYTSGRSEAAISRLKRVDVALAAADSRYPVMAAESAWVRALILGRMGEPQKSLDAYRFALAEAKRGGEIEHVAAISGMISWVLESVGDRAEADQLRMEALRRDEEINAAPDRMYVSYLDTAFVALRSGRPHLALALVDAMAPIAVKTNLPLDLAQVEAWRALGLLELGKREGALSSIAAARAHAMRIPVEASRDYALANIDYTEGRLEAQTRPDRAVLHYSSAIAIWERYGWRAHTAHGLLARGEAELVKGDRTAAEASFRAGLGEMEQQRSTLEEPSMRVAYFERSDRLFDRLIRLLVDDGRAIDALSVVERKRARMLLDRIGSRAGTPAAPLDAGAITRAVRGRTALLEIALLDDGVELWLIREGKATHARVALSRVQIEEATTRHLAAIDARDEASLRRSGRWLYDRLIAPLLPSLDGDLDLVIVADGVLQLLPMATLVTPSGTYLIEECTVAVAPSASVFLRSPGASSRATLLAVAEPAPAGFARLAFAEREAVGIARSHPRGEIRVGAQITAAEFLAAAGKAGTVHFAGHGTTEVDGPGSSSLIFESPDGGAVRLSAREIGRSTLAAHPLVVLAACGTGRGTLRRTEGIESLASAFLQAGAHGVAATLWDIDDQASARLFRLFHENLRDGRPPSRALRDAQRSLLQSNNARDRNPAVWGSVTIIGTL